MSAPVIMLPLSASARAAFRDLSGSLPATEAADLVARLEVLPNAESRARCLRHRLHLAGIAISASDAHAYVLRRFSRQRRHVRRGVEARTT